MSYTVDLQNVCDAKEVPELSKFTAWVALALKERRESAEVTIRIVDAAESADLNSQYRKKNGPTNVLSFPFMESELPAELAALNYIGDLVICAEVMQKEAAEQHKLLISHWAHIVIHGCLHLLGYDHVQQEDAVIMENIEIQLLQQLGYPNPYDVETNHE